MSETLRHPRIEIENAREKLVHASLRLFAEKGFEGASTREIAERAGVNISAIRYYFGDKAGLYRAAFTEPLGDNPAHTCADIDDSLPLDRALEQFFAEFLEPLKRGEDMRLVMKLHFREMIEPTGIWAEAIETEIKPQHEVMVRLLARLFGLPAPDLDVQRVAIAIVAMAVHFYVGQEVLAAIAPEVIASSDAIDLLAVRLASYAVAIIEAEAARRGVARPLQEPA